MELRNVTSQEKIEYQLKTLTMLITSKIMAHYFNLQDMGVKELVFKDYCDEDLYLEQLNHSIKGIGTIQLGEFTKMVITLHASTKCLRELKLEDLMEISRTMEHIEYMVKDDKNIQ